MKCTNTVKFSLFTLLLFILSFSVKGQSIQPYLDKDAKVLGLSNEDISDWRITDQYTDKLGGVQHIYFSQQYKGVEVYGANGSIHLLPNGDLLTSNNQFIKDISKKIQGDINPGITAIEAVEAVAAQLNYSITEPITVLENSGGPSQAVLLSRGGISRENIPVKLMFHAISEDQVLLVWDLSIYEPAQQNWWSLRVDASTGKILDKSNWVVNCEFGDNHNHGNEQLYLKDESEIHPASTNNMMIGGYNVFPMPVESPNFGVRALILNPDNATASPFGWHDTNGIAGAEYTITRGNNVHAYEDGDNPGFSPDGGAGLLFDFPINLNYSPGIQSEPAVISNLFYWNNIIHDVTYQYGYNEASGNFQSNNYGKGGVGNDYVQAEAQDGSGTCNANFGTPPDGSKPTMQMYICSPHDGDIDNGVIVHEYGHGISNRLTGGPANVNCLNNQEQMGEGWSDWYAIMLTMKVGDTGPMPRPMGTWLFNQPANGPGIRTWPYSTNMAVNPHTYNSIKTEVAPHGVGSVWCAMLWEVTWALINQYGFSPDFYNGTAGNNKALALVTMGMKLQPCSPGFVTGRDAILAADVALYGGANQCLLWTAFAKRGLGYSANQGSSSSKTDGTEAFNLHPSCLMTGCDIVITNIALTHPACPNSNTGAMTITATSTHPPITYTISGPVNASNTTGTFTNLLPGVYTVTVTDLIGGSCIASTTATINQGVDVTPPTIVCPPGASYSCASQVPAPNVALVTATDNCPGTITKTFVSDVISGQTCANRYTLTRTYRATDANGNSATCSQIIIVNDQTPPSINCPAPVTVQCTNNILPNIGEVSASDNCAGVVTIAFVNDVISNQTCPNKYDILRTYRATDVCGNSITCVQTIKVSDNTAPVINGVPPNMNLECDQKVPAEPSVTGTDNCGGPVTITFTETNNKSPWKQLCESIAYDITRTWTATDACGNVTVKSQTIGIKDTKAPTFKSVPPPFITVECDDDNNNNQDPVPVDACDLNPAMLLDIKYDFNPNGCINSYVATYTWTAGDKCGNTAQYTQVITVSDKTAPEITCPGNIVISSSTPIAVNWVAPKADDHCDGPTKVTQKSGPPPGSIFQPNTNTVITYQTSDECGNVSTCSFTVIIKGSSGVNSSKVSGDITNLKSILINNTEVEVTGDMNDIQMAMGTYEFGSVPNGSTINIFPKKNTNALEGVNTLDVINITNHILGKKLLDSPYKILAADVNNSGYLSTADLVELRSLILHITDNFTDVESWEFMPAGTKFTDPQNPWNTAIQSSIELENIQADQVVSFKGIKMGDVTGDATGKLTGTNIEVKDNLTYNLTAENQSFAAGDLVELSLTGKELQQIKGFQFTLEFDPAVLEFERIRSERTDITNQNFGLRFIDKGKLTASIDLNNVQEELFKIQFRAKNSGQLAKEVRINSNLTSAEAYNSDLNTIKLNLEFTQNGKVITDNDPVLYQNEPNPFSNTTAIRFYLPETQESTINVYNIDGKLIKEVKGTFSKGENQINLDKEDLLSSGIYYYQLQTANYSGTKKMVKSNN